MPNPPENRMVERKQTLHARAKAARREAVAVLGEADSARFRSAIDRYVNAVEVADQARRSWEDEGRPLWTTGSQGQQVEHPLVRTMDRLERAAMAFGGVLGLDPASAKRLAGVGVAGRPVGAVSAEDRKSAPPVVKLKAV